MIFRWFTTNNICLLPISLVVAHFLGLLSLESCLQSAKMKLNLLKCFIIVFVVSLAIVIGVTYYDKIKSTPTFGGVSLLGRVAIGAITGLPRPCNVGFMGADGSPSVLSTGNFVIGTYGNLDDQCSGNLYSINPTTLTVDRKKMGLGGESAPIVSGSRVYAWSGIHGKTLSSIDADTFEEFWSWQPSAGWIAGAGAADRRLGLIFAGTSDSNLLSAINTTTGETVWEYNTLSGVRDAVPNQGAIWSKEGFLDATEDTVCLGLGGDSGNPFTPTDCNASVMCLDKLSSRMVWRTYTGGQIQSKPSRGASQLFVGSYEGWLYSMDLAQGGINWKIRLGGGVQGGTTVATVAKQSLPVMYQGSISSSATTELVLVGTLDGYFYAFHGETGQQVWKVKLARGGIFAPVSCAATLSRNQKIAYMAGPGVCVRRCGIRSRCK
jgi:outer membrane protein assembly factor BamB